jgi:hypothetical protein
MENLVKKIAETCEYKATINPDKRNKIALSSRTMAECLIKFESRYEELKKSEEQLAFFDPENRQERLDDIQINFYNKNEAFHQSLYTVVSTLINMMNHIAPRSIVSQMPINSASKFIAFLEKTYHTSEIKNYTPQILESILYRSKTIDHPQNNKVYDWMTYGYFGRSTIIHISDKKHNVTTPNKQVDPYSTEFKPPLQDCNDFFVAPDFDKCYTALINLLNNLIKYL